LTGEGGVETEIFTVVRSEGRKVLVEGGRVGGDGRDVGVTVSQGPAVSLL
jgi:hypothetical protein